MSPIRTITAIQLLVNIPSDIGTGLSASLQEPDVVNLSRGFVYIPSSMLFTGIAREVA
jgi:hypothetical protein